MKNLFNKTVIALIATGFFVANSFAQQITVKGSDALYPVVNKLSGMYTTQAATAGTSVKVIGGGSTIGLLELLNKRSDLATSTRRITPQEIEAYKAAKVAIVEVPVAREAIVLLVNPKNPIYKLSKEQLKGIFTGKITNWKDVGGENLPIVMFIRGNSSGCYEGFQKDVLDGLDYSEKATMANSNIHLKEFVANYPGAIGFLGYGDANDEKANYVKAVKVSADGNEFAEPSWENIDGGVYPFVRDCFVYYRKEDEGKEVAKFANWLMKADAQSVFQQFSFVSIKTNAVINRLSW